MAPGKTVITDTAAGGNSRCPRAGIQLRADNRRPKGSAGTGVDDMVISLSAKRADPRGRFTLLD